MCDTGTGRVLRIDPQSGATTTLVGVVEPRGIDVARDGSLYYVIETAESGTIVRVAPNGSAAPLTTG